MKNLIINLMNVKTLANISLNPNSCNQILTLTTHYYCRKSQYHRLLMDSLESSLLKSLNPKPSNSSISPILDTQLVRTRCAAPGDDPTRFLTRQLRKDPHFLLFHHLGLLYSRTQNSNSLKLESSPMVCSYLSCSTWVSSPANRGDCTTGRRRFRLIEHLVS